MALGQNAAVAQATPVPATQPVSIWDPSQDGADIYSVTVNPGSLANGVSATVNYQLDASYDFFWVATQFFCDLAGAAQTVDTVVVPLMTLIIYDGGSRRQLMDSAVPIPSLASPLASEPYRLLKPRLFRAASNIKFTFANYSAGTTYSNTYLTLLGFARLVGA